MWIDAEDSRIRAERPVMGGFTVSSAPTGDHVSQD